MHRDFATEDALPRLLKWNLVSEKRHRGGGLRYVACTIEEAHSRLIAYWSSAYEALGRPPQEKEVPLTSLFANPNLELPPLPRALSLKSSASVNLRASSSATMAAAAAAVAAAPPGGDELESSPGPALSSLGAPKSVTFSQEEDIHFGGERGGAATVKSDVAAAASDQKTAKKASLWKRIFKSKGRK